jgi:PiT family inorganic phosphate transporter
MTLTLLLAVVLIALIFEFINGFHDTANSIATVVATKVLTPGQAILLASSTNLIGALLGTAVAKTISGGIIDSSVVTVTSQMLICALSAGIVWNLITWYVGLPSSSSHALIGGLIGAAIAATDNNFAAMIWSQPADPWYRGSGVLWKVVIPMILSPLGGFIVGYLILAILFAVISSMNRAGGALGEASKPRWVNGLFGKLQIGSAAFMGLMHGTNDAQKTMGIITLALVSGTAVGTMDQAPEWLQFMHLESSNTIPTWVIVTCALTMAAGTAMGGWRIIKTMGHKMVKLHPIHGFAAETASASMIGLATHFGIPVSTTHNISAAIMGVGAAKGLKAVKWSIVERMVWAWIMTIPITGLLAYTLTRLFA